jgi:hypothetical protein
MLLLNLYKFKFGNSKRQEKLYFLNEQGYFVIVEIDFQSFFIIIYN